MEPLTLLLLFLLGKRGKRSPPGGLSTSPSGTNPSVTPSPLVPTLPRGGGSGAFADAWRKRCNDLLRRAAGGDKWQARMVKLLGSQSAGVAAATWIGIESGGRPLVQSSMKERGLVQMTEVSAQELGMTPGQWAAMADPKTSDDSHALIAAQFIAAELAVTAKAGYRCPDPGWGPSIVPAWGTQLRSVNGIGIAKLRHGLPLLARELHQQGLLLPSIGATLDAARASYKPSDRIVKYAKGAHALTGDTRQDLLLRFLASAAVIALGNGAVTLGDSRSPGVA